MNKKILLSVLLLISILNIPHVSACGLWIDYSYIGDGGKHIAKINNKVFYDYFLETSEDMFSKHVFHDGMNSREAQIYDFESAVEKHFPDMPEEDQKKLIDAWTAFLADFYKGKKSALKDCPALPEELQEFRLYLQGFDELAQKGATEPTSWYKLLSLPPSRRHYRTVWTHYILGNWDKKNLHFHAQKCREAAAAGFSDTAGLAWGSYKQEARYGTDPVKIIHALVEGSRGNKDFSMINYFVYFHQKYGTFKGILYKFSDEEYQKIMDDPIGRNFALVFDYHSKRFHDMLGNRKIRYFEILAYYHWMKGNVDLAREYLSRKEKDTLLSVYLEAEFAFYDGNLDLAEKKLHQWLAINKESFLGNAEIRLLSYNMSAEECDIDFSDTGYTFDSTWERDIYGKLACIMLEKKNYVMAAEYFFRTGRYQTDFPYVAEFYLTLDELCGLTEKFLKEFPERTKEDEKEDDADNDIYAYLPYVSMRECAEHAAHMTARRAFREKRYDIARKYMPKEYIKYLDSYLGYIAFAKNPNNDSNARAIALYNAAKIMRYKGLELCGTQHAPDNYRWYGNHEEDEKNPIFKLDYSNCKCDLKFGSWTLCNKHAKIFREHAPGFLISGNQLAVLPNRRWHYHIRAAKLVFHAAQIAEDQDLKALIYLFGHKSFGKGADYGWEDIFYKCLVRHCRNTKLGKLADKRRWFPVVLHLQQEILIDEPISSLDAVKELMNKAFPEKKNTDTKK